MPATFTVESSEFVISRFSRTRPDVVIFGHARNEGGRLFFRLMAPGHDGALQQIRRSLEARYTVEAHEGEDTVLSYNFPESELKGLFGPVLSRIALDSNVVLLRLKAGRLTFHFPDLDAAVVSRTLKGRLGAEAPEVTEQVPVDTPEWLAP